MVNILVGAGLEGTPKVVAVEGAELSNAPDSRAGLRLRRNEGSNPSLSARSCAPPQILGFGRRCRFGKVDFMSQMLVPVSFGELLDKIAKIGRASCRDSVCQSM